jgi:hypothetical protein
MVSISATKVRAVTGPMLGTVVSRLARAQQPTCVTGAVSGAIRAELAGLAQRACVALVRLHLAASACVHRREVWVGHDHLVAQRLQVPRHPFTFGCGLEQDARRRARPKCLGERVPCRPDAKPFELTGLLPNTHLSCHLVHVDANLLHGRRPFAALTASLSRGASLPPRLGAGRFIPSTISE